MVLTFSRELPDIHSSTLHTKKYTLVNDTQPRWDSTRSVGAGNDRNERYPSFPTIALPLELEQAIFAGFGRSRLCMEGINLGFGKLGNN